MALNKNYIGWLLICSTHLLCSTLLSTGALAQPLEKPPAQAGLVDNAPWTAYFGSHYQKVRWADSVRDPSGPGQLAGPVSADKLSLISSFINNKDIILGAGGLGSGRNQDAVSYFLTRMLLDYGEGWKEELKAKAKAIALLPSGIDNVYWQFGNEINSQRFSQTIQAWDAEGGQDQRYPSDAVSIPYYVEYYLAPGVEALREAAAEKSSARFKVVLGSVASFANPRAQTFLDHLLSYRIEGLCAPGLAGKTVADIVDVLALHYIASANTDSWRQALDTVKDDWLGRGEIEAIWSTEELGIRRAKMDAGAVFTIQVAARYLDWWHSNGLNPSQGRAFFWGADVGPEGRTGSDGMGYLLQVLGNNTLKPMSQLIDIEGKNIESYTFNVGSEDRILTMVFPRNQRELASITKLNIRLPLASSRNRELVTQLFSSEKSDKLKQIFSHKGETWVLQDILNLEPMSMIVISSQ